MRNRYTKDRFAYFEKDDGDFRITFDKNITTRREDVRIEHGSYGMKDESEQKQFIDELRVRNGNLNITMGTMPNSDGGNLN